VVTGALTGLQKEVLQELWRGEHAKEVLRNLALKKADQAEAQQRLIARENQDRVWKDDGIKRAAVHPMFFHYWGQRLGYDCWDDDQFMREFLRDNEDCRVKSRSDKIMVGYQAAANYRRRQGVVIVNEGRRRYRKVYA
jgi:hypothetical protein